MSVTIIAPDKAAYLRNFLDPKNAIKFIAKIIATRGCGLLRSQRLNKSPVKRVVRIKKKTLVEMVSEMTSTKIVKTNLNCPKKHGYQGTWPVLLMYLSHVSD